jgi:hypothetical protein
MGFTDFCCNHPEFFTATLALGISVWTIIYTKKSVGLQHEHNRKSLTPLPWVKLGDYTNNLYVILENHGVGPMIIKRVSVYRTADRSNVKKDIHSWMPHFNQPWEDYVSEFANRAVRPGCEIPMISLLDSNFSDGTFTEIRDKVRISLSELTVEIEFVDIYDNKMPIYKRDLKWFSRKSIPQLIETLPA